MSLVDQCSVTELSHIGNREENQDRYCVLQNPSGSACLYLVADGMGGHQGGALAAQTIVDTAASLWQEFCQADETGLEAAEAFLYQLVSASHEAVRAAGETINLQPRSTLIALMVLQAREAVQAISIHAGDSRISQYDTDKKISRTIDHSLAQLKVLQGKISEEAMASDPDQGTVISNIGGEDPPDPEITLWDLRQGSRFTICSDGFWEIFSDAEVMALFGLDSQNRSASLEAALAQKLNQRPKHDNTTVIMVEIHQTIQGPSMNDSKHTDETNVPHDVEDPVTNPGKRAASEDAGLDAVPAELPPNPHKDKRWILAVGIVVILAGLVFALLPGGEETDGGVSSQGGNTGQGQSSQNTQTADAGETAGDETGGETIPPSAPTQTAGNNNEGEVPGDSVLDAISLETNINVGNDEELIAEVTDILVLSGQLGEDDTLAIDSDTLVNGNRVIRLEQSHLGIPVFGGVVVAIENNGNVGNLSGSTGSGIDISVSPALTYEEALAIASNSITETISSRSNQAAELVIVKVDEVYYLAWLQLLIIGGSEERVFLDAQDGSILLRLPAVIGEA